MEVNKDMVEKENKLVMHRHWDEFEKKVNEFTSEGWLIKPDTQIIQYLPEYSTMLYSIILYKA